MTILSTKSDVVWVGGGRGGDSPVHVACLQVEHVLGGGGGIQHVATCKSIDVAQYYSRPKEDLEKQ